MCNAGKHQTGFDSLNVEALTSSSTITVLLALTNKDEIESSFLFTPCFDSDTDKLPLSWFKSSCHSWT